MSTAPVRVFIGSGEASVLERKTLLFSLRAHTRRPLDVYVFNGTHNAVEHNDEPPRLAPMSLRVKYQNFTEFSLYRFLIPQLCNYQGRAIFLDSDTICLSDIGELFDTPMDGADILCTKAYGTDEWATSVMLLDCERCRFSVEQIFDEIDAGRYTYSDFTRLGQPYLAANPLRIRELDSNWNVFDRHDEQSKLIHYTHLMSQPWRHQGHPFATLWLQYFRAAVESHLITEAEIQKATWRGYARAGLLEESNSLPTLISTAPDDPNVASEADNNLTVTGKRSLWFTRLPRKLLRSA